VSKNFRKKTALEKKYFRKNDASQANDKINVPQSETNFFMLTLWLRYDMNERFINDIHNQENWLQSDFFNKKDKIKIHSDFI